MTYEQFNMWNNMYKKKPHITKQHIKKTGVAIEMSFSVLTYVIMYTNIMPIAECVLC
jgi:hypothetical protein